MRPLLLAFSLCLVAGCSPVKPIALAQSAPTTVSSGSVTAGATSAGATSAGATSAGATSAGAASAGAASAGAASVQAPSRRWSVLGSFPHDTSAFTEGLLWNGGKLYESTGNYGQSSLRRVDLQSGQVEKKLDLPRQLFGEGLALANHQFYQLTWETKRGFVYDQNFKPLSQFSYSDEGWGLTFDGKSLVQSDGTDTLTWRDPKNFAAQKQVRVTWNGQAQRDLNELEWIGGRIWANVWHTDNILIINPRTGRVESFLDLSALWPVQERPDPENVLNGIAYDSQNQRLFVTGKNWPKLFWLHVE